MERHYARYRLAGLGELDESFFGAKSREAKTGHGRERKPSVLIAVSVYTNNEGIERPGFVRAESVTDASAEMIGRILDRLGVDEQDKKLLMEKMRSHGWRSYGKLAKDNDIEQHRVVPISPKMAGYLVPWTHRFVSNVKAVLKGPHRGVSAKHLQRYLAEACYRFNRQYWDHELFNRLLFACTVGVPIIRGKLLAPGNGSLS